MDKKCIDYVMVEMLNKLVYSVMQLLEIPKQVRDDLTLFGMSSGINVILNRSLSHPELVSGSNI